jgi:hypothetical protein
LVANERAGFLLFVYKEWRPTFVVVLAFSFYSIIEKQKNLAFANKFILCETFAGKKTAQDLDRGVFILSDFYRFVRLWSLYLLARTRLFNTGFGLVNFPCLILVGRVVPPCFVLLFSLRVTLANVPSRKVAKPHLLFFAELYLRLTLCQKLGTGIYVLRRCWLVLKFIFRTLSTLYIAGSLLVWMFR